MCPNLTFIAPANMIALSGAKLKLVDVDKKTLTIDPELIEKSINPNTKAIVVVHQFGHAAHMDKIKLICDKYNLFLIEDNAESIGGKFHDKLLGTIGDAATYSFFANKIITTGEGGAVLTNCDEIANKSRILRDHGMDPHVRYKHVDLGYNYRMTNMQAAVGLAQIEKLDEILKLRMEQMIKYYECLKDVDGIKLRTFEKWCKPVHWLMTIELDNSYDRAKLIKYMYDNKIECRIMINPVSEAVHFKNKFNSSDYPNSLYASNNSMHLPSGISVTNDMIEYITETIRKYIRVK